MSTTVTDIRSAERQAADAAAAVEQAEARLASGERGVTASRLHTLRDKVRHSVLTAEGLRLKAEAERQEARRAGLEELGAEVDALAVTAGSVLEEHLADVAAAVAAVRSFAAEHDARVRDLAEAALDLGAEPGTPSGPRESSAYVTAAGGVVTHKRVQLRPVADALGQVIEHAVSGSIIDAMAAAGLVRQMPPPRRADHYLRSSTGVLITRDGALPAGLQGQVRAGTLVPLRESEIQAYLRGEIS
jgi:hypothetical protein